MLARWPRRALLVAWVALAGCTFDAGVPSTAVIRCDDGVCPRDFVCRARIGLCVPVDQTGAAEAPRLARATVSPGAARDGTVVTVEVVADRELAVPPVVTLLEARVAVVMTLVQHEGDTYTLRHVVHDGIDTEGPARVVADLVATSGVEALGLPVGVLNVDFTAPRVLEASFSAPRAGDDAGVLVVRAGELAGVRVVLSEVAPGSHVLRVATSTCDAGMAFSERAAQGAALDFISVNTGLPGCAYTYELAPTADVAGNTSATLPLPLTLSVDGLSPGLSALRVLRPVDGGVEPASTFSRQPGFDQYLVRFEVDDTQAVISARLDQRTLADCGCTGRACECRGVVGSSDTEGGHVVSVAAIDSAGNVASVISQLQFDFTPPSLVDAFERFTVQPPADCPLASPTALAAQGSGQLALGLDEPGRVSLSTLPAGALSFRSVIDTPTHVAFQVSANPGAVGQVQLVVDVVDDVGNAAQRTPRASVVVDAQAPPPPLVGVPGAVTFRRAPWGSEDAGPAFSVAGLAGSTEGAAVQVLADGAPLATTLTVDGGFQVAFPTVDRPTVSVRAFDPACNASAAVQVRDVEWLATLAGKVPGSRFENPHQAQVRTVYSPHQAQAEYADETALPAQVTAAGAWRRWLEPPATNSHRLAYDSVRGRVVLFGGAFTGNDLFEYDGVGWLTRTPVIKPTDWPTVRRNHCMAFDVARQRVVVFGGSSTAVGTATNNDELWEYDGFTGRWQNRTPPTRPASWPAARSDMGCAYDTARRRLVVFGGQTTAVINNDDLWEWDGEQGVWTNRTPSPRPSLWPPGRSDHAMAYDSVRGRMMVFGAISPTQQPDVWEWNGAAGTWQRFVAGGTWPSQRWLLSLAYDSARQRVVMFGGTNNTYFDELWEWDGAAGAWANRTPAVRPVDWPTRRAFVTSAFDASRGRVVVFGGLQQGAGNADDTWEWDGTQFLRARAAAKPRPGTRLAPALTGTGPVGTVLMFGGAPSTASGAATDELWEWQAARALWVNRTPTPRPSPWPSARVGQAQAYDPARGKLVLFGGGASAATDELWELDVDAGTWAQAPRVGSWPGARSGSSLAYDPVNGRATLYGATGIGESEVWDWDGVAQSWTNRTPTVRPTGWPVNRGGVFAYDVGRARFVLFGGANRFGNLPLPDTLLEWDAVAGTWADRSPSPRPAQWPRPVTGAGGAFDSTRGVTVLFGGQTDGYSNELWELRATGPAWTQRAPAPRPLSWPDAVYAPGVAYAAATAGVHVYGGQYVTGSVSAEHWEWRSAGDGTVPAVVAHFDFAMAGAPSAQVLEVSTRVVGGATAPWSLAVSSDGVLQPEASGTGTVAQPSEARWQTVSTPRLGALFSGAERRVSVAISPSTAGTPNQPGEARLAWAELWVRYRLP